MTIEEKVTGSLKASTQRRYLALILGAWFILEYLQLIASTHNIMFTLLRTPMMVVTPLLVFFLVRYQRQKFFKGDFIWLQGFYYSIQFVLYAGLLEAFFCLVLNKWIMPNNLAEMHTSMIQQYEEMWQLLQNTPYTSFANMYSATLETLKEAPIETPINAAINLLSTDMLYGTFFGIINGFILKQEPKSEKSTSDKNKE